MSGLFITLESSEGAGKGTAKEFLRDCLTQSGKAPVMTREPGGTPFAEHMREVLLSPSTQIGGEEELLLLFAARVNHLAKVINPAVSAGKVVICERFCDSTLAYQHFARGCLREPIDGLIQLFNIRSPDLTFYLDVPPEVGMARASARGALDRIEQEEMSFFHRVRNGFLQLVDEDTEGRFRVIDAEKSLPEVRKQFISHLVTAGLMTPKAVTWVRGKYDVAE